MGDWPGVTSQIASSAVKATCAPSGDQTASYTRLSGKAVSGVVCPVAVAVAVGAGVGVLLGGGVGVWVAGAGVGLGVGAGWAVWVCPLWRMVYAAPNVWSLPGGTWTKTS